MGLVHAINKAFNSYLSWIVLIVAVVAFLVPGLFDWAAKQTVSQVQTPV